MKNNNKLEKFIFRLLILLILFYHIFLFSFLFTREFLFVNVTFGIVVTIIPTFGFFVGHFCLQNSKTVKTEEK